MQRWAASARDVHPGLPLDSVAEDLQPFCQGMHMPNESHKEILASHPFTSGLEPKQLDLLLSCSRDRIYGTGGFLCREGEPADSFFLIWEGRASLEAHVVRHGGLRIETVHPGEVLGWSWMVPPRRWRLDARAIEPVRVVVIDAPALRKICEQDHELGFQVLKRLAQVVGHRLTRTRNRLIDLHGRARRETLQPALR